MNGYQPMNDKHESWDECLSDLIQKHSCEVKIKIAPSQWAPGIYAGNEGNNVKLFGRKFFVSAMDMAKGEIYLREGSLSDASRS